jgi:hypothetical protein
MEIVEQRHYTTFVIEEAEAVAYRRAHAAELAAEEIAEAVWTESDVPNNPTYVFA